MSQSAICARMNHVYENDRQGSEHLDCAGNIRYLESETGDYVEDNCECFCHVEKREWYLSDFGPPPHKILWIGQHKVLEHD
jgi:hypothetical protein